MSTAAIRLPPELFDFRAPLRMRRLDREEIQVRGSCVCEPNEDTDTASSLSDGGGGGLFSARCRRRSLRSSFVSCRSRPSL